MPASEPDSFGDDPRLNELLAEYLQAAESGRLADAERLLAEHPEYADELREFLEDQSRIGALAGGMPGAGQAANPGHPGSDLPTMPPTQAARPDAPTLDAVAAPKPMPRPGAILRYFGDYELLEEIARGGMGVVYKARQVKLNRLVAIKMILAGQLASKEDVQRFYTEAESAAGLDHPFIVPIFEVGEQDGQHYFSMGFVNGPSLSSRLADGPLPPRDAAELVRKVADGVQFAHDRGVIHRDLKPANVLLQAPDGRPASRAELNSAGLSSPPPLSSFQPRITDFGLAKKTAADSQLTGTGQILGTPSYMPPEQAAGRLSEVRETADVYALGAILYAALTGRPPFQADNPLDTLMQVLEREPVSPRTLNPAVPRDLETICLKCLEKDRRRRYASAQEFAEELQRFLNGEPILARPISRPARFLRWCRRNPLVATLVTAVLVTLVAGSVVSTLFAVEAHRRALGEAKERKEAQRQADIARENLQRAESLLYANLIAAAQRETELNNPARALALLDRSESAQRGWEYYYLRRQNAQSLKSVIRGHGQQVTALALSSNDELIASASRDRSVKLWNRADSRLLRTLDTDRQLVVKLAISSDAARLAGISTDGKLRIWESANGNPLQVIVTHTLSALGACNLIFTPDGETVITANKDGTLQVWNVISGEQRRAFALPEPAPWIALSVSRDGRRLACGRPLHAAESEVRIFELESGEEHVAVPRLAGVLTDMALDAEGHQILSSTIDRGNTVQGAVQLWDVKTGKEQTRISFRARQVAFAEDERQLIGIGADGSMKTWDASSGTEVRSFKANAAAQDPVTFSRRRGLLVSGNSGGSLEIWETGQRAKPLELPLSEWGYSVDFGPDGTRLVSGSSKVVSVWDAVLGKLLRAIDAHQGTVNAVAFHPNGQQVLSGSWDATIKLWNVETGTMAFQTGGGSREYDSLAIAPRGDRFAFGPRICSAFDGRVLGNLASSPDSIQTLAYGPGGNRLVTGGQDGSIRLWDESGQAPLWTAQAAGKIRSIDYSGDGKWIATVGSAVEVWDAASGRHRFTLQKPATAYCVRFSPDSRRLVAGCSDATLRFWSADSGQPVFTLEGHQGRVYSLAFSPDGQRIATTGDGGAVYVWDGGTQAND